MPYQSVRLAKVKHHAPDYALAGLCTNRRFAARGYVTMPHGKVKDWADGISQPLRQLVLDGADDQELEQFIEAMKSGSSEEAARILNVSRPPRTPRADADLCAETDELVRRVSTAALRPVVNDIDVRLLQSYMETVRYVAKHVVMALEHEPFWLSDRAVNAVGDVVAKFSLDQINRYASRLGYKL